MNMASCYVKYFVCVIWVYCLTMVYGWNTMYHDTLSVSQTQSQTMLNLHSKCNEDTVLPPCDIECVNQPLLTVLHVSRDENVESVKTSRRLCNIKQGESTCTLDVLDLCSDDPNHASTGAIKFIAYVIVICNTEKRTRLVFTNKKHVFYINHIGALHLHNCDTYWKDLSVYAQSVELTSLYLKLWRDEFISGNETYYTECVDPSFNRSASNKLNVPIKGLDKIGTLNIHSMVGTELSPVFATILWPVMAEVQLIQCHVTQGYLRQLQTSMPKLQTLMVVDNALENLPLFPWYNNPLDLPWNLSRSASVNDNQYAGAEGIMLEPYVYRRIFKFNGNNLTDLDNFTLQGFLHKVELQNNNIISVSRDFFREVQGIQVIDLSGNKLRSLPKSLFWGLISLTSVVMKNNKLTSLHSKQFKELRNLVSIILSHNMLTSIDSHTFINLNNLKLLDISSNELMNISDNAVHQDSSSLTTLNLKGNNLQSIPVWVFMVRTLVDVDVSNNNISFPVLAYILNSININELLVMNNKFESKPFFITYFRPIREKCINLQNNSFIPLNTSLIQEQKIIGSSETINVMQVVLAFFKLDLSNNDIACDCHTYEMYKFLKIQQRTQSEQGPLYQSPHVFPFHYSTIKCFNPQEVRGQKLVDVDKHVFRCIETMDQCPLKCTCFRTTVDNTVRVDCKKRGILHFPLHLPNNSNYLTLANNNVHHIPVQMPRYVRHLQTLDLSMNALHEVPHSLFTEMPIGSILNLHGNKLQGLPKEIQNNIININVTLSDNAVICDCNNRWLHEWVRRNRRQIIDLDDTTCASGNPQGKAILDANIQDFVCHKKDMSGFITAGGLMGFIILACIIGVVVYKKRGEIKLYLFMHYNWHPFDKTDDSDITGKIYDAFVSYNTKDYKWVCHTLRSQLENITSPYKLCIHDRDFLVGAPIEENIMNSIKYSRRMVMVLSDNFLKSDWCILEFRSAHLRAMKERSNYLIVVLYNEVSLDDLDDDLKLYLKTNTYLTVDNKWFWDKLRYAMPHTPISQIESRQHTGNQGNLISSGSSDIPLSCMSHPSSSYYTGEDPSPSYRTGEDPSPSYHTGEDPSPSYHTGEGPSPSYHTGEGPSSSYHTGEDVVIVTIT